VKQMAIDKRFTLDRVGDAIIALRRPLPSHFDTIAMRVARTSRGVFMVSQAGRNKKTQIFYSLDCARDSDFSVELKVDGCLNSLDSRSVSYRQQNY